MIILILFFLLFLLFFFTNYENFIITTKTNNKYVCIFAYYEKDETYKENLNYFINNGIYDNIDYFIIINGTCTVNIPNKKNINVIYRENKGYDFGAWNYCVNQILKKSYDYYIFLNSSVRGPYLDNNKKNWLDEYLKLFNDPDIKLVGSSINIYTDNDKLEEIYKSKGPYTHVQSMFFILNKEGFEFLKINNFFNKDYDDFHDLIIHKEVRMSQMILKNNWNINCILSKYSNYDYRKVNHNFNPTGTDPYWKNSYFGESINPYEVIFYKNNR